MNTDVLAAGPSISIRKIEPGDLERLAQFEFVVSVTEPLADSNRLQEVYAETGLWLDDAWPSSTISPTKWLAPSNTIVRLRVSMAWNWVTSFTTRTMEAEDTQAKH